MWSGTERRGCLKVNGNLTKLREITMRLLDTETGENVFSNGLRANKLFSDNNCGILEFNAKEGTIHERHYHPMNEWLGVTKGHMVIHYDDGDVEVKQYEAVMVPAGKPHKVEYPKETHGWAITMPKDEGF